MSSLQKQTLGLIWLIVHSSPSLELESNWYRKKNRHFLDDGSILLVVTVIKHEPKANTRRKKLFQLIIIVHHQGKPRWKCKAGAWRWELKWMPPMKAAYWLAFSGLLCYLFVQLSHVLSSDTCSQRAGPPSIKNIFLQICPESSPKEGIRQLKFPLARVMSTTKVSHLTLTITLYSL